jgi:hypothetical protein
VSSNDPHDTPAGAADDGHDAAGDGADTDTPPTGSSQPTTPLSAFIWPLLITLITLILVWGPVTGAFARFSGGPGAAGLATPTPAQATAAPTQTAAPTAAPTGTAVPTTAPTAPPATDTAVPATATAAPATETPPAPTETSAPPSATAPSTPAAAAPPPAAPPPAADGASAAPRSVTFGGKEFRVEISNTTVPDWLFSKDPTVANWVSGTVVNYVLGVSYSPANAALFAAARPSNPIKLARADGGVFTFVVDKAQRVSPTDTSLLAQDHPAVTLLLLGDPADDRALVQGHYAEASAP